MNFLLAPKLFGAELEKILAERKVKHYLVAERLGITDVYFSKLINGHFKDITATLLVKLSQELGSDFQRLFQNAIPVEHKERVDEVFEEVRERYLRGDGETRADISSGLKLCFGEKRRKSILKLLMEYEQTFPNGVEGPKERKTGTVL